MARTTTDPTTPTPVTSPVDLASLREQKRQLDAAIKAAKAALPQQTALEKVIAKQSVQFGKWLSIHLAARAAARIKAGQERDLALREVIAFYSAQAATALDAALAAKATDPTT